MSRLPVLGVALLLAACQAPCTPPPQAAAAAHAVADEAMAALARSDWASAAPLLREALTRDAGSVTLHYNLAVCATYLDAVEEAAREFRWVLEHAAPNSEEAKMARSWLAPSTPSREPSPSASLSASGEPTAASGAISGFVTWAEPGRSLYGRQRQLVLLQGIRATPTKGLLYRTRTDERGHYELKNLVPGPYKVTDAIAGVATWRLRVVVEPGQTTVLDLSTDNSLSGRDDFPEPDRAPLERSAAL